MGVGIECLLTDSDATAQGHAEVLDRINLERRDIEQDMRDKAYRIVEAMDLKTLPNCVCLYDPGWHQGVVGLVAGRVKERFHRPVVAFAKDNDGNLKGSMRSVPGVHARDLLDAIQTQSGSGVIKFGGHAMAAGLTLDGGAFGAFTAAAQKASTRLYPDADFSGAILSDGMLPSTAMSLRFARELRDFGPWGSGFPEPCFHGDFHVIERRTVGERHLKLRVAPADGRGEMDAIAFNQADASCRGLVRLAYRLDVNEFRGVEKPQLVVEQISQQHASG
jgi:single-stranded-DNA-specific exonuclease